ncbi:MAG: hypothetical protein FWB78_01815 [Treponema sp.]|nr:hypothetical protein [Treponema sp.]
MSNKLKKSLITFFFLSQGLFLLAQDYNGAAPLPYGVEFLWEAEYAPEPLEPDVSVTDDWALEIIDRAERFAEAHDDVSVSDTPAWPTWEPFEPLGDEPPSRERFAFRNRTFEMGMQVGVHVANNVVAFGDETIVINLADFFDGFRFNFGFDIAPLSLNINIRDRWGFGFDIAHISATGNLSLPSGILSFPQTSESFGAGGAAFVEFGIPVFFHTPGFWADSNGFRVSVRPAAYIPLVHMRPGITYRGDGDGMRMDLDIRVFSPLDLYGFLGDGNGGFIDEDPVGLVNRALGYDISLGFEYSLFPRLTVGVDFINIPLFASRLDHYARIKGYAYFDSGNIDFGAIFDDGGDIFDDVFGVNMDDAVFGSAAGQRIRRPFSMMFHADFRPLGTPTVSILPSLGFSINNIYARIASLEGGLSARLDLANILITTVGINYNDRRWINSLDLALNLRVLEIGFGVSMQSQGFVQSFQGKGVGVNVGLRMGW